MSVNRCRRSKVCDCQDEEYAKNGGKPASGGLPPPSESDPSSASLKGAQIAFSDADTPHLAWEDHLKPQTAYIGCATCDDYIDRRIIALTPHVIAEADRRGEDPAQTMSRYRQRVHEHHQAGNAV